MKWITKFSYLRDMIRYFIEIAYNGKDFHGWQIQPGADTVQGELNRALSCILHLNISVTGAGRTDTGVHASFYVAHFDLEEPLADSMQTVNRLNRILGERIAVYRLYPVKSDAHARFSAISRTYRYFIDKKKNPFTCDYAWKVFPMPDIGRMNKACQILTGYTDFTSFSKLHSDVKNNNCTVTEAYWEDRCDQLIFTISANRFLRNMVRAIVGTMLEIGQGRLQPDDIRHIIESRNRCKAGMSVPGHALFLCRIEYPENICIDNDSPNSQTGHISLKRDRTTV